MSYSIIRLCDAPEWKSRAAGWFHEKWGVPEEAYLESMEDCLSENADVPQWYLAVEDGRIVGGLGVIENDFHERKDLAPNVCAVYTEPDYRGKGIAGRLLDFTVDEMKSKHITPIYLITDHVGFYERYGWEFYCVVQGSDHEPSRMYIHR